MNTTIFSNLDSIFSATLNIHAPFKEKLIRGNHKPFFSKPLKKEIMKRAHLIVRAVSTKIIHFRKEA